MTVNEAAKVLNVMPATVRTYIKQGKLKATANRRGLRIYYEISETDLKELQNFLNK